MLMAAFPGLSAVFGGLLTVWDSEDDLFPRLSAYFGACGVGLELPSGTIPPFIPGVTGLV